jgi:hypothetical protein
MTTFTVLGADPDTRATGLAVVRGTLPAGASELVDVSVLGVASAEAGGRLARSRLPGVVASLVGPVERLLERDDLDLAVVEGCAHRRGDPRPDDIVQLAVAQGAVAGVVASVAHAHGYEPALRMPLPVEWKGTRKKADHQRDLLRRLNLVKIVEEIARLKAELARRQDRCEHPDRHLDYGLHSNFSGATRWVSYCCRLCLKRWVSFDSKNLRGKRLS